MDRRVAPDRGYAWVVLAASLGCNYLSGVLISFVGVIHVELLDKFHGDVTTTAWAGSLYSGLELLAAPLASGLVYVHSCRLSVVLGSVLLCVGFVTSAYITSVEHLVFTYGLIAGTGLALTYSPSLMIISFYFQHLHDLASGLSASGFGVGILTGSMMAQAFIDTYSLRGAFLIIAGLGLQGCVFGMFYRPTRHEGVRRRRPRHGPEQGVTREASGESSEDPALLNNCPKDSDSQQFDASDERRDPVSKVGETAHSVVKDMKYAFDSTHTSLMCSDRREIHSVSSSGANCVKTGEDGGRNTSPLLNQGGHPDVEMSADTKTTRDKSGRSASPRGGLRTLRGVCSLLKNWAFLVHCLGVFFAALNISGVYLHLPKYARTQGTPSTQAAVLFVGVGVFNIVARIGSGLLLTSQWVDGLVLSMGLTVLCGLASCLFSLYSLTYAGQMVFASLFGLVHGGFSTLITVLIVQLVHFHSLPAAYGLFIFVMGLGYVAGPPLSGLIVDQGGTYGHSFIFLGMVMFASATCDFLVRMIHKRQTSSGQWRSSVDQGTAVEDGLM